ncbi:TPA: site-specific DNA-methyltransferase [Clostridioides difficile]|nr:site-specific DNA-methyltransferase [Clostridioides difficile]
MITIERLKIGNGELIHMDNISAMDIFENNYFDSCISDFPYDLAFMNKIWDKYENFYEWNMLRAKKLLRIIKPGGYVLIFGHHRTNHRMKCAFEDVGFKIVEEIVWVYGSGFPKNQDISKLFNKKDLNDLAEKWNGWKTSGLKPAKEIITVFQKPLEGSYIDNIKKYNCGCMNLDTCRIPISKEDIDMLQKKASKNPTNNYSSQINKIYGKFNEDRASQPNELGRFPSNIIFDNIMGTMLDKQSGIRTAGKSNNNALKDESGVLTSLKRGTLVPRNDVGGASRFFLNIEEELPFMYSPKATKKEKGDYCKHVTVKPKKLIKWLIKLTTPHNGKTIDITSGSGTHGLCCEELNKEEKYNLSWVNIELLNTKEEPYIDIANKRISDFVNNQI